MFTGTMYLDLLVGRSSTWVLVGKPSTQYTYSIFSPTPAEELEEDPGSCELPSPGHSLTLVGETQLYVIGIVS
jgi:hypothetical protein